mgnify:FL=1
MSTVRNIDGTLSGSPEDIAALTREQVNALPVEVGGRTACCYCNRPFVRDVNVFTPDGWREVRISGMCETCFDEVCAEPDEDDAS